MNCACTGEKKIIELVSKPTGFLNSLNQEGKK
jgi:hypothetical protein